MPNVQWNEPAAFKRNYPKPTPWIDKAAHIRFGVVTVAVLLLRVLFGSENSYGWGPMLLIALMVGAVFGYGIPLIFKIAPANVIVSAQGINHNGWGLIADVWPAVQQTFYDWQTFTAANLETMKAGDQSFRVLHIKDPTGKTVALIALAQKVDESALRAKFGEHGKQLQIR